MFLSGIPVYMRIIIIAIFVIFSCLGFYMQKRAKLKYKGIENIKSVSYREDFTWSQRFSANIWFTTSIGLLVAAFATIFI